MATCRPQITVARTPVISVTDTVSVRFTEAYLDSRLPLPARRYVTLILSLFALMKRLYTCPWIAVEINCASLFHSNEKTAGRRRSPLKPKCGLNGAPQSSCCPRNFSLDLPRESRLLGMKI